ncbi:hypothetical protein HNO89_001412 [Sporosarcina luteola]|nr:hypothetical protein [Sporosarcina luteola]
MKNKFLLAFSALLLSVAMSGVGTASAAAIDHVGPCKPGEKFCHIAP